MKAFKYKEIDSTQDQARRLITEGEEYFFVLAENQSSGRGTQGRTWVSVPGLGLYFSAVTCLEENLYQDSNLTQFSRRVTEAAVIKLKQTLLEYCASPKLKNLYIKPINDLYYDEKKLAGILVEHIVFQEKSFLIIGVGLNLKAIDHSEGFSPISLEEICGSDFIFNKENFAKLLAAKLLNDIPCLTSS